MRTARRFALTAMLGVMTAISTVGSSGCKKHDEKPVVIEPPDLQMVSQGNEPRKLLAYHIAKGTTVGLEVEVDMTVNAGEMGGPLPTIVTSMLVAVEDVRADGEMRVHTTIVDAQARERDNSTISPTALAGPLDAMKGLAIETMLSPNGRVKKGEVQGGKQLPDDVAQQLTALSSTMEQVMMPLPAEPVGVGAVWRSSREIQQNGMKLTSVNTFGLTAIDGDKLSYTIDTDVHGADQTIKQADQSIDMKDITGTGAGKGTFSLSKLEITSELELEFRSQMAAPGDPTPTQMKMSMQTRIHPTGAPPPTATGSGSATGSATDTPTAAGSSTGSDATTSPPSGAGSANQSMGSGAFANPSTNSGGSANPSSKGSGSPPTGSGSATGSTTALPSSTGSPASNGSATPSATTGSNGSAAAPSGSSKKIAPKHAVTPKPKAGSASPTTATGSAAPTTSTGSAAPTGSAPSTGSAAPSGSAATPAGSATPKQTSAATPAGSATPSTGSGTP